MHSTFNVQDILLPVTEISHFVRSLLNGREKHAQADRAVFHENNIRLWWEPGSSVLFIYDSVGLQYRVTAEDYCGLRASKEVKKYRRQAMKLADAFVGVAVGGKSGEDVVNELKRDDSGDLTFARRKNLEEVELF